MIRKLLIIGVVVLIVGVAASAFVPNLVAHIGAKGESIADLLDKKASLEELINIANKEVEKSREKIYEYKKNISRCKIKANLIAEDVEELKERKAGNEAILMRARKVLKEYQRGDIIMVNNKPNSWERVSQDALIRVNRCKALRSTQLGGIPNLPVATRNALYFCEPIL